MGFGDKSINKKTATLPESVNGNNPAVTPADPVVVKPADEKLVERQIVDDTFHNETAVNTERFPGVIKDMRGFAAGHPIKVTYYKEHYAETNSKGRHNTEESTHKVHRSVLKIKNFELLVSGDFSFNYETEEHLSKIDVEAFTYPGFEPECGDKFLYEIELGRYGVFQINQPPVRTTIRASTYHKCTFNFLEFIDNEGLKELEKALVGVAYFDKARFLAEPGALLFHDEVVEIEFCEKQRAKMINYYQSKFLDDQIMFSYMRPDNVYDPYVTDFMLKILDFDDLGVMATQLYQEAPFIDCSIWRAFLDPDIPLEEVPSSTAKYTHRIGSKSVLVTSLINKNYVEWIPSMNLKDYLDELMNPGGGSGGETPEGEIPADPTVPTLPEDEETDKMLGDLLLHIHPHYTECPLLDSEASTESIGGTGDGLGYILGEGDQLALIAYFLLRREIRDVQRFHTLLENVWKMPKINQFYLMPVLIFMCSILVKYIRTGSGVLEP